jgi:hypothetical protein
VIVCVRVYGRFPGAQRVLAATCRKKHPNNAVFELNRGLTMVRAVCSRQCCRASVGAGSHPRPADAAPTDCTHSCSVGGEGSMRVCWAAWSDVLRVRAQAEVAVMQQLRRDAQHLGVTQFFKWRQITRC